jgi:hypothetical protein
MIFCACVLKVPPQNRLVLCHVTVKIRGQEHLQITCTDPRKRNKFISSIEKTKVCQLIHMNPCPLTTKLMLLQKYKLSNEWLCPVLLWILLIYSFLKFFSFFFFHFSFIIHMCIQGLVDFSPLPPPPPLPPTPPPPAPPLNTQQKLFCPYL